ncbi:MAG TPA: V-type ATP synthase subunit F [bacterium]|nr:V-type ATP synthase subunit F [bacterium]HPP30604.1 V-type ATP synthase subunit F [bacterium]
MEKKIGFIGEKGSTEFFNVFGADVFPASNEREAEDIIEKLNLSEYGVIFITEEVFNREHLNRYVMEKKLVVIPSLKSKEGKGYHLIDELIKKATGMKG